MPQASCLCLGRLLKKHLMYSYVRPVAGITAKNNTYLYVYTCLSLCFPGCVGLRGALESWKAVHVSVGTWPENMGKS